jgi:hypothetical protein
MSSVVSTPVFVRYVKYTDEDFKSQPELNAMEIMVLKLIHALDKGDARGCYATNLSLAEMLGILFTAGSVKGYVERLRKKGYIATLGYELGGNARRRVILKHARLPKAKTASREETINGRVYRSKRKASDPIQSVFLRSDLCHPPAQNCVPQKVNESLNSDKTKETADAVSFVPFDFGSGNNPGQVNEPVAATTSVPGNQQDTDSDTRRSGKINDPVEKFLADPAAQIVVKHFKLDEIDPALAKSFNRKRKNYKSFNPHSLEFVLRHLEELTQHGNLAPCRTPRTLPDLLKNFSKILQFLQRVCSPQVAQQVRSYIKSLGENRAPWVGLRDRWQKFQAEHQFATFVDYFDYSEPGDNNCKNQHHKFAMWAAAHFLKQGEQSVLEDTDAQATVAAQCVTFPEAMIALLPEMEQATGLTYQELLAVRANILTQLTRVEGLVSSFPTYQRFRVVLKALPTFVQDQASQYLADKTMDNLEDRLGHVTVAA